MTSTLILWQALTSGQSLFQSQTHTPWNGFRTNIMRNNSILTYFCCFLLTVHFFSTSLLFLDLLCSIMIDHKHCFTASKWKKSAFSGRIRMPQGPMFSAKSGTCVCQTQRPRISTCFLLQFISLLLLLNLSDVPGLTQLGLGDPRENGVRGWGWGDSGSATSLQFTIDLWHLFSKWEVA